MEWKAGRMIQSIRPVFGREREKYTLRFTITEFEIHALTYNFTLSNLIWFQFSQQFMPFYRVNGVFFQGMTMDPVMIVRHRRFDTPQAFGKPLGIAGTAAVMAWVISHSNHIRKSFSNRRHRRCVRRLSDGNPHGSFASMMLDSGGKRLILN